MQRMAVKVVSMIEMTTCQAGGAGVSAIQISIWNGVAGGNIDVPIESGLAGFSSMAVQTKTGSIDKSITGIINFGRPEHSIRAGIRSLVHELEVINRNRLAQPFGQGLIEPRGSEPPCADFRVDQY
jgi:hypothetical protein